MSFDGFFFYPHLQLSSSYPATGLQMDTSSATHVAITSFSDDDVESFKETDTFINSLHQQPKETQSKLRRPLLYIWGLSTIFLMLLCSLLLFKLQRLHTIASYVNGFNTDFGINP
jgi:hypothetical protein